MRREEKRQARRRRSIQKRAELLDAIDFGKKERARSSKDGCIRWRYEYEGWVYVTDETSQHEVVRWKVSLPVASCRLLVINEPAFAENHSDSKGTSRETQVGNALPAGEKPVAERCGRTGQQSTQGQSDREVEEKTRQCMEAKLVSSIVKAGKIASHFNMQRAEAEAQEQRGKGWQRLQEEEQAVGSLGKKKSAKEEQTKTEREGARTHWQEQAAAEARRTNTNGVLSSVIKKREDERAKLEGILRNAVAWYVGGCGGEKHGA